MQAYFHELEKCKARGGRVILAGNGGSAGMAAHVAVDFTKNAGLTALTFNEAGLITCFANDYGYELWVEKAIEFYSQKDDLVILISSSGQSKNMTNAAKKSMELGLRVVTISGFKDDNPLRKLGHVNLWVNSSHYNYVEMTHHIWLLAGMDWLAREV